MALRRNSKGQFVKSGGSSKKKGGGGSRASSGGGRRGGYGLKLRSMLPSVSPVRMAKVTAALLGGTILRSRLDIPYISEEALGVAVLSLISGNASEKGVLIDVAGGLQIKEVLDRTGITDAAVKMVTPGARQQIAPGTTVYDANGKAIGEVAQN